MRNCPTCGERIPENSPICTSCGMEVKIKSEESAPPAESPNFSEEKAASSVESDMITAQRNLAEGAKASLLLKRGGFVTGDIFYIGEEVIIGRFDAETGPVDVDLSAIPESTYISRIHAKIYVDESGQWQVCDLGSNNGTFLWSPEEKKPRRIPAEEPAPLNDGDEVAFGNARFEFHVM
ncbi:MAG: hypothetical protein A2Y62_00165 [Candidatus Fischerbacteria bacterium RBG_13_37_8]|uniref:FHA domain-containing protein n=1 Tax=Candidatus Fischerbacteria bacterium RBG_13_37_8 TaxID=1817863 RepID=A0A1F5VRH5_9BACT|nr:MAG: hypothetical protein A2Y62_00165 [Candidatus Fischerbacteria bacterium RBG_13_37_8]